MQPTQKDSNKYTRRDRKRQQSIKTAAPLITGLPASSLVSRIQEAYPKYDKHLHSKCERTEEYGITLCEEGMDLLLNTYGAQTPKTAPQRPNRRNPLPWCRAG